MPITNFGSVSYMAQNLEPGSPIDYKKNLFTLPATSQ